MTHGDRRRGERRHDRTWNLAGASGSGGPAIRWSRRHVRSTPEHGGREHKPLDPLIAVEKLDIYYGDFHAVRGVDMLIGRNEITALIGPSGCGKSTVIRCFDRMNDLIPSARVEGKVLFHGQDLYAKDVDPIEVRRRVGMVFQKPNPFPKSIFDNVAYGPKVVGEKLSKRRWSTGRAGADLRALGMRSRASWTRTGCRCPAVATAAGHRPRRHDQARGHPDGRDLFRARPIAIGKIEDRCRDLVKVSLSSPTTCSRPPRCRTRTAFFTANVDEKGHRYGQLVEYDRTSKVFTNPDDPRTEDYISGRFG